jgi:ATP-dependent Lon protease
MMIKPKLTKAKREMMPVLPLRDIVVFPHMIVPLFVGRPKSVEALESVMQDNRQILLLTQKSSKTDNPRAKDMFEVGVIGTVLQMLKLPDGTVKVLVEGGDRAKIVEYQDGANYIEAAVDIIPEDDNYDEEEMDSVARAAMAQFEQYVKMHKKIPPEVIVSVNQIDEPSKMADTMAAHLVLKIPQKQEILEIADVHERFERIFAVMEGEIDVLQVEKKIRMRVKKQMEKNQRDYYLNEQMKAIQKELNDGEEGLDEIGEIAKKVDELKLTKEARDKAKKEIKKLRMMNPMSAESTVLRNYLDWIVSVPWKKRTKVKKDLEKAQEVLDADHHGLEKVKERILEYLAVQQRTGTVKGPILCLLGPPGVGKTSLGKSIATATNRNFVRMSLGGVRDESEIRGHRRTYIGALPGKIIQGMKKAKSSNPLFLLDEIDKLSNDWRGDPSSALLEVLDPEQNATFQDHYLEVDYDLSDVMFICTANDISGMSRPLLDRMEIIRLSGYTEDEKIAIAQKHLIKKQMAAVGLKQGEIDIPKAAIRDLIRYYTREAGVRNLEREIGNLCRKALTDILKKETKGKNKTKSKAKGKAKTKAKTIKITPAKLKEYAGVKKYRYGEIEEHNRVGVVNGLAYNSVGGDLLSIEAVVLDGKDGKVSTTGNLKDVMKESITVAEMLVKSRAAQYGIDYEDLQKKQIHVHVPAGATPKDGPSAGAAMVTAILSALTDIEIRNDIAMTGEINLRGNVTAIGGLKEKLLSALRGGIKTALIPKDNEKDLEDIPDTVKKGLEIIPVETIDEVLHHALVGVPQPLKRKKSTKSGEIPPKTAKNSDKSTIHH